MNFSDIPIFVFKTIAWIDVFGGILGVVIAALVPILMFIYLYTLKSSRFKIISKNITESKTAEEIASFKDVDIVKFFMKNQQTMDDELFDLIQGELVKRQLFDESHIGKYASLFVAKGEYRISSMCGARGVYGIPVANLSYKFILFQHSSYHFSDDFILLLTDIISVEISRSKINTSLKIKYPKKTFTDQIYVQPYVMSKWVDHFKSCGVAVQGK